MRFRIVLCLLSSVSARNSVLAQTGPRLISSARMGGLLFKAKQTQVSTLHRASEWLRVAADHAS
jgi:hypothetical protein